VLLVDSRTLLFSVTSTFIPSGEAGMNEKEVPLVANLRGDFAEFLKRPSFMPFVFFTFPPVLVFVTVNALGAP